MLARSSPTAPASAEVQASGAGAAIAAMNLSPTTTSHAGAPDTQALVTDPATMPTSLAPLRTVHCRVCSAWRRDLVCGISCDPPEIRRIRLLAASGAATIDE